MIRRFQPQYLSVPRDFTAIPNAAINLEIGAGKGKHAALFATQHPEQQLVAIERTRTKFQVLAQLQQQLQLPNLLPIHADVIPWMVHALYPQQVERLFILYPNPEPHNPAQRWLNMPFFEYVLSRLKDGAQIVLASNIGDYINEAQQQLQQVWHLPYQLHNVPQDSARTHFEIKYLARGENCQQLTISKPQGYQTRFDDLLPRLGCAIG